jgi:hypothetical protein
MKKILTVGNNIKYNSPQGVLFLVIKPNPLLVLLK